MSDVLSIPIMLVFLQASVHPRHEFTFQHILRLCSPGRPLLYMHRAQDKIRLLLQGIPTAGGNALGDTASYKLSIRVIVYNVDISQVYSVFVVCIRIV